MSTDDLINVWRHIIVGKDKSWMLFEHGTCVILMQPEEELAAQVLALMQEWGPVQVGTPAGDFNVVELVDNPGWVVTSHHPDILTYVAPDDMSEDGAAKAPDDMLIGLLGRSKRAQDAAELKVIHVEDKRSI